MSWTVLVTDFDYPDLSLERGVLPDDVTVVPGDASSESDVVALAAEHEPDAILSQYAPVTAAVMDAAGPALLAVGRYGIGYDVVDVDAASERDVAVLNVPDYCVEEVATHALSLLLSLARHVPAYDRAVRDGDWDWKSGRPIHRVSDQTLGLVGFGKLPRRLARLVSGFDVDVVASDPHVPAAEMAAAGVEPASFEDVLARADYVSVHVPLTPDTEHLFDADAFAKMQDDAYLVNTARGGVVDTDALADALDAGELRGAALDVLPEEPPADSPVVGRDDVVLTPHAAWYSEEALVELRETLARDVARVLRGEEPENRVN